MSSGTISLFLAYAWFVSGYMIMRLFTDAWGFKWTSDSEVVAPLALGNMDFFLTTCLSQSLTLCLGAQDLDSVEMISDMYPYSYSLGSTVDTCTCVSPGCLWTNLRDFPCEGGFRI